ncbi:hypothetical protein [Rhodothermus marinus]|uniref:hypothetical protein n=1 Tax=Rhodothermus marinus TaxID=29549 RepID=UPI000B3143B1|nr:hypothetical protein [Rhodothermus marinus]
MAEFGAASENKPIWWYETGTDDITLGLRMRLLHRERTPYQLLEIYEHPFFGRVLVLDAICRPRRATNSSIMKCSRTSRCWARCRPA